MAYKVIASYPPYMPSCFWETFTEYPYYKRLAMHMGLAYYLHRQLGGIDVEYGKPYNETLGIKYALTRSGNVYLGYHVRAHLFRADHMEFKVGFRVRTGKGCQRDSW